MFEGAAAANAGFQWRQAVDARKEANDANSVALALAKGLGGIRQRNLELEAENEALRAQVVQIRERCAIAESFRAGLFAQLNALKQAHPTSGLFQDSNQRYLNGTAKSRGRLIFDAAFDVQARQWNIPNPASIRDK